MLTTIAAWFIHTSHATGFSGGNLLDALLDLVIIASILSVFYWILTLPLLPLPEPVKKIVTVIFVVICLIVLISWLMALRN